MLIIYSVIIEVIRELRDIARQIAKHDPDLARQLRRAANSMSLNTAEGMGVTAGNERLRFRTALGSTQEVRACLDSAEAWGYVDTIEPALKDRLDCIAATLYKLAT